MVRAWRTPAVVGLLTILLGLGGCGSGETGKGRWKGEYPIQVVTTTGIVGELVKAVGRDQVVVKPLMGPGSDPHSFRPSAEDIRILMAADAVAVNGLGLEPAMADALGMLDKDVPFLAVGERLPQSRLIAAEDGGASPDPHFWLDAALVSDSLDAVAQWLGEIDPAGAKRYPMNAGEYKAQCRQLHEVTRNRLSVVPGDRRLLVSTHPSLAYFARAYGFEVPDANLEARSLVDLMVARKIPVLFSPNPSNDPLADEVVALAKARGATVKVVGSAVTDSLGQPRTPTGSYTGLIEQLAGLVVQGLSDPR